MNNNFQKMIGAFMTSSARVMTLTALTVPSMRKTNNPYLNRVQKLAKYSVQSYEYGKVVNARLVREGKEPIFESGELPWGSWVEGYEGTLLTHKDKFYLRYYPMNNNNVQVLYLLDGRVATAEETADILSFVQKSKASEQGGLTKKVIVRSINVENIVSLTIDGTKYVQQAEVAVAI